MILRVQLLPHFPADVVSVDRLLVPAKAGDAGVDLHAAADVVVRPGERALVPTGIAIALPPGTEGQVRARSGNALRLGLTMANGVGTIDEGFRAEVQVPVHNSNPVVTGEELLALLDPSADREMLAATVRAAVEARTVRIARGDRIAQLIVTRYERPRVQITEALPDSERGLGGFGSTGVAGARV